MNTKVDKEDYEIQLRGDDSHFSQLRVVSKKSPIIFLDNFVIKLKKYYRELHLDINIFRAILLFLLSFSIYNVAKLQDNSRSDSHIYDKTKDIPTLLIAGLTILFTMNTWHNQYHHTKLARASKFIEFWNDKDFLEHSSCIRKLIKEEFYDKYPVQFNAQRFNEGHCELSRYKETSSGIDKLKKIQSNILNRLRENETEAESVRKIFNFFEHMGQDVKLNVADSDYLKDFFYLTVITYYELFRKYIEYNQFKFCNRQIVCNFVYLAQTWEKEGSPPSLPMICKRPLILISDDFHNSDHEKHFTIGKLNPFHK